MPEATRQGPAWSQVHAEEGRAQKTEKGLLMARLGDADPDTKEHIYNFRNSKFMPKKP